MNYVGSVIILFIGFNFDCHSKARTNMTAPSRLPSSPSPLSQISHARRYLSNWLAQLSLTSWTACNQSIFLAPSLRIQLTTLPPKCMFPSERVLQWESANRSISQSIKPSLLARSISLIAYQINQLYLAFVATKDIPARMEFTLSYNPAASVVRAGGGVWKLKVFEGALSCHCSSTSCLGWRSWRAESQFFF